MITLGPAVPHRDFLAAMLGRHYDLTQTPTVLITTALIPTVAASTERVILITDSPEPTGLPTLIIGATATPHAAHARLSTDHPAELLSVIDGYLRHPERFPLGATAKPLTV